MDPIERINWLAHRWLIKLDTFQYGQAVIHVGNVECQRIWQGASCKEYDAWIKRARPECLARFIAGRPALHPAVVLVVAGDCRMGRIPPELWCGYDVIHLLDLPDATLLSAKVRAMFPAWPSVLLRIVRSDQVPSLNLRPARKMRDQRLKLVA